MTRMKMRLFALPLAASLAVAACAAPQAAGGSAAAPIEGTSWVLTELHGAPPVPVEGGPPTLEFTQGPSQANGFTGCNRFSGPYQRSSDSLRIGPLVATQRACLEEAANAQEVAYARVLEVTTRYAVSGDVLALYADEQLVAQLRRTGR